MVVSSVVVVCTVGLAGSTMTVLQDEKARSAVTASRDEASVFMMMFTIVRSSVDDDFDGVHPVALTGKIDGDGEAGFHGFDRDRRTVFNRIVDACRRLSAGSRARG